MKLFIKSIQILLVLLFSQQVSVSQTCPTSSISAGTNTTICRGNCASLAATIATLNTSSSYSVASIPYAPFPFGVGTTAIPNVDDVWSAAIPIGFNFCYFGNTFTQLLIGSNGEITFNTAVANGGENYQVTAVLPNLVEHQPNTICGPIEILILRWVLALQLLTQQVV
jgi:hypothetical protein